MRLSDEQTIAAFNAARKLADESGYGQFISDETCKELGAAVGVAVLEATQINQTEKT